MNKQPQTGLDFQRHRGTFCLQQMSSNMNAKYADHTVYYCAKKSENIQNKITFRNEVPYQ